MTTRQRDTQVVGPADVLEIPEDLISGEDLVLDFSVVKEYEPVAEDRPYLAVVTKMEIGKAASGQRKATLELVVESPVEFKGHRLGVDMSLQPQALFNFYNLLVACGESPEQLQAGKLKIQPEKYLGLAVVTYVRNETYNDITRSKPRRFRSAATWDEATENIRVEEAEGQAAF